jgi:hypothetical protein
MSADGTNLPTGDVAFSNPLFGPRATGENVHLSSGTKSARTMQKRQQYENLEELAAYA